MVATQTGIAKVSRGILEAKTREKTAPNSNKTPTAARAINRCCITELATKEELKAIRPELDGVEVMKQLDVPAGPIVGGALKFLLEIRLEEGLIGDDEIRRRLDAWWAAQPKSS